MGEVCVQAIEQRGDEPIKMLVAPAHRRRGCGLCCLYLAAVLPPQVFGVINTCLIGRRGVPFISAAGTVRASRLLSMLKAWPTPKTTSEKNSVALSESRTEFLYNMHLRVIG